MSKTRRLWLASLMVVSGVVAVAACSGGGGGGGGSADSAGAGTCTGVPAGPSVSSCTTGVPEPQQCLEFIGSFWNAMTAEAACTEAITTTCPTANRLGRCLRNCGRPEETLESFYSGGPFTAASAQAVCNGYAGGDPVAPIFIPES